MIDHVNLVNSRVQTPRVEAIATTENYRKRTGSSFVQENPFVFPGSLSVRPCRDDAGRRPNITQAVRDWNHLMLMRSPRLHELLYWSEDQYREGPSGGGLL
jgi:hypothetical protein